MDGKEALERVLRLFQRPMARTLAIPNEDVDNARAYVAEMEQDAENMIWNLAIISTIACAENLGGYIPGTEGERAALADVVRLLEKLQLFEKRIAELEQLAKARTPPAHTSLEAAYYEAIREKLQINQGRLEGRSPVARDLEASVQLMRLRAALRLPPKGWGE